MLKDRARKALAKKAKRGYSGYPVATVAFYGPTDKRATKLVVGVVPYEGAEPEPMRKWFSEGDLRKDAVVLEEVLALLREHDVKSVAMIDRIVGCPHEEGIDYPEGEPCPKCPFWKGRDRWTGRPEHQSGHVQLQRAKAERARRAAAQRQEEAITMHPATDLHAMARRMKAAQDQARQLEPLTSQSSGFDVSAAYAVAHLVHDARLAEGAVPVGRKIGFTNPQMWSQYGVGEPIWAYIYDRTVQRLSTPHARCDMGRLVQPKIEPEIVFHFRSAPPVGGDLAAILDSIDWVAHAFEIVQCHFPGWKFQAADAVADWALHGTLLVGEPRAVDCLGANPLEVLESFALTLSCGDEMREMGKGSNVLGSPLAAIAHLIAVLAEQPTHLSLQPNEIVTTGTITTAHAVHIGEIWRSELQGIALPGLSVEFLGSASGS